MAYVLLIFSIMSEVLGSTMLKLSNGFKKILPIIGVIAGYCVSFYLLSVALLDLPLGFAYAIWSGVGTILTAMVGVFLFKEKLNRIGVLGISFIVTGVVLLNLI
ncbi:multidrug efflux SMR transporter [Oceanobacillus sp. J11TS1]|uniref:DMT family transporter n=1 Tax=Oceanobacillus sp. J11TS1 TaxID=2807191 RepID=UPI001B18D54F|nr:multidrug efflux SMR transporter [Oceanobacillus sp. J11TS1]GIO25340.1 multidrug resistance protein [Oceanobacillus sp. J11TS1]